MAKDTLNLEVKSNIKSVTKDSDALGRSIGKAVDETKGLGGTLKDAGEKGAGGFKKMGTAVKGMGMALKAAGIGLIVALVAKLMEVFSKNQKVVDAFDTAMTALSIAFNDLFSFLSESVGKITGWFKEIFENPKESLISFGDAIKENLIERFNSLLEVFGFLGKALKELMDGEFGAAFDSVKEAGVEMADVFTGVDGTVEKVTETFNKAGEAIIDYTKEVYDSAKAITQLNKAAEMAAVVNQGIIADKVREAELLRQTRDSEKETFAARIKANQDLKVTLEAQKKAMLENANIMIAAAQAQKKMNGSQENKIALQQAINEKKAIEEQITGFMSEQLQNQESLERELAEVKKELAQDSIEGMERELLELKNSYESKLDMARKADVDSLALTEKYERERQKIIDDAANARQEIIDDAANAELAIRIEAAKKIRAEEQKTADFKNDLALKSLQLVGSHIDASISELEGSYAKEKELAEANGQDTTAIDEKYEKERKRIAGQQKAFKVAEALITTYQMASLAYKDGLEAGGPYGLVLGPIAAGVAAAAGLANVRQILAQDVGGGGGGGAPSAISETPAPQMMSGAFELTGGQEVEPARAYVVSDDITDSQNGLAIIRRRATI